MARPVDRSPGTLEERCRARSDALSRRQASCHQAQNRTRCLQMPDKSRWLRASKLGSLLAVLNCRFSFEGFSFSSNAVNQLGALSPDDHHPQSSVAMDYEQCDDDGRMKPSPYYDKIMDAADEFVKNRLLTRGKSCYVCSTDIGSVGMPPPTFTTAFGCSGRLPSSNNSHCRGDFES